MVHVVTETGKHDFVKESMLNYFVGTGYVAYVLEYPFPA